MSHRHQDAWITCSYLQSFVSDHFYAFYCVLSEVHDCVLHTKDVTHGILSDIHALDVAYAMFSDDSDIADDRIYS